MGEYRNFVKSQFFENMDLDKRRPLTEGHLHAVPVQAELLQVQVHAWKMVNNGYNGSQSPKTGAENKKPIAKLKIREFLPVTASFI